MSRRHSGRRRLAVALSGARVLAAALAMGGLLAAAAVAGAATGAAPARSRLQGSFDLAGRVTVAVRIRGERRGAVVSRVWTFLPRCDTGPCATVTLLRQRGSHRDRVRLTQRRPNVYVGSGVFWAPLACGGRVYRPGERVPYTITVQVTTSAPSAAGPVATRVAATYVNPSRRNLTPCVAFLGHDAARYHGHLMPPPAT